MNYIKHLSGFFNKVQKDDKLNPTHISLYVSLFQFWNATRFQNPISISRGEVMKVSKICAKATYHKCIKDLHNNGYINYQPSYNPFKGSLVYMLNFQPSTEQVVNRKQSKNETSTEQALVPYINNTNINKQTNEGEGTPTFDLVNAFFEKEKFASAEVVKFFNYYQANGWLMGGKTPIQNWQSAAINWMMKVENFKQTENANKSTSFSPNKNYSEPL